MAWYGEAFDGGLAAGDLRLRVAHRTDHATVLALMPDRINGADQAPKAKSWLAEAMIGGGHVLVAEDPGGEIVGAAVLARRPDGPVEIGWSVGGAFAGRGYATAIAEAVTGRLLDGVVDEVRCTVEPHNAPSLRIAEKLGFSQAPAWLPGALSFSRAAVAEAKPRGTGTANSRGVGRVPPSARAPDERRATSDEPPRTKALQPENE